MNKEFKCSVCGEKPVTLSRVVDQPTYEFCIPCYQEYCKARLEYKLGCKDKEPEWERFHKEYGFKDESHSTTTE